ncbi:scavenger receptor cysteine-rich type 1 protein M130-like [Halichondria panicea]|uniref:scavenger receptor cysteine-rich type 1 protein M130-like n=1 Tax=Halichondria panicea TaxID=6063 RepID=UPI00312BB36C
MQVTSLLLLATTAIATAQSPECFNGQLRESNTTLSLLEYCYDGEWRRICSTNGQWKDTDMSVAVCTELGYSESESTTIQTICRNPNPPIKVFILSDCKEPGLTNCTVASSDNCVTSCFIVSLQTCNTANCADGEIRLVGGSTDREGRVEVCVGGRRWRTVCTGSQELAGTVCSQMGYIFEESPVANSFPPGAFPEYRLNCTQLSNGIWHCSPVKEQCDSFVELGVVCYERSKNSTSTQLPSIARTPGNEDTTRTGNSTTFIAGIGVLVVLLLAVSVGWIVSCVILLKRGQTVHKQHVDAGTISTRSNQSYTQQNINTQLYAEATPPDKTYNRLNRSDKQTEEIATYDYADPNQIRVERSQATNPPPVSGEAIVREEEFYIAEDHTYAAVNKKAKKKKKLKIAESDGEGESEAPPPFVSTLAEV